MRDPAFNALDCEYYVGHEPPPPPKRTITLNVNGKEWVLPEPLTDDEPCDFYYISEANRVQAGLEGVDYYDNLRTHIKMNGGSIYATEAGAQAWADFNKWCRGGGVGVVMIGMIIGASIGIGLAYLAQWLWLFVSPLIHQLTA